ncbi:MAG: TetR/AcrR family transcriptional regulator [Chthoniobacteraceae bacterium]
MESKPKSTGISAKRQPQSRSVETRAGIMKAAARIFAESGLAGARTDAIADAAGVNKALLYYYFKSKECLYQAVLEDHASAFNKIALEMLNSSEGPAGAILLKYVGMHFDFMSSRLRFAPLYHQMMSSDGKMLNTLVTKYIVPRSQALKKLLERGMRDGEFRQVDTVQTLISIGALTAFYFTVEPVVRHLGCPDIYDKKVLKRRKQEVLDFIRHGLFLKPEAPL